MLLLADVLEEYWSVKLVLLGVILLRSPFKRNVIWRQVQVHVFELSKTQATADINDVDSY